jgi:hypothetical protein
MCDCENPVPAKKVTELANFSSSKSVHPILDNEASNDQLYMGGQAEK